MYAAHHWFLQRIAKVADAKGILVVVSVRDPDRVGQPHPVSLFKPILPYSLCAITEAVVTEAFGCRDERHGWDLTLRTFLKRRARDEVECCRSGATMLARSIYIYSLQALVTILLPSLIRKSTELLCLDDRHHAV